MIWIFTLRGWATVLVAVTAPLLPVVAGAMPTLALVNETRSLPRGLYLRRFGEEIRRGATAAANQPEAARGYLGSLAAPADMLLLKRVAAIGGDLVCSTDGRVSTPAGDVGVLAQDRRGAVLKAWTDCRRLEADEVFLLGETEDSFDSRYFGPVNRSELRGAFRVVVTW